MLTLPAPGQGRTYTLAGVTVNRAVIGGPPANRCFTGGYPPQNRSDNGSEQRANSEKPDKSDTIKRTETGQCGELCAKLAGKLAQNAREYALNHCER